MNTEAIFARHLAEAETRRADAITHRAIVRAILDESAGKGKAVRLAAIERIRQLSIQLGRLTPLP